MSDTVIRVEGLSKQYRLGTKERYRTLRDTISSSITYPIRRLFSPSNRNRTVGELIWALEDVSYEVKRGEVVGLIGRNGAGKSTLLKLLSRIIEPTRGYAEIRGRVGSLLEVGTGFHPELTGRENIYLNGAILGMKKVEIERRFDEIVAFAEIEQSVDTAVKHYSSGMYVRLAFAVAAHMESDILLVDEVLAVGDIAFQKKCTGKIGQMADHGRTILFVSHQMAIVQNLCGRAILLKDGRVNQDGPSRDVINTYLASLRGALPATSPLLGRGPYFERLEFTVGDIDCTKQPTSWSPFTLRATLTTPVFLKKCYLNLTIDDAQGRHCIHLRTDYQELYPDFPPGSHHISVHLESLNLLGATYFAWFRLVSEVSDVLIDSDHILFDVVRDHERHEAVGATVAVKHRWDLEHASIKAAPIDRKSA